LHVRVIDRQQVVYSQDFAGSVELGRQSDAKEELYSCKLLPSGRWRAVIARVDEDTLSRRHACLEPLEGGRVRITNVSAKVPIRLGDGTDLPAGATCEVVLPAQLAIGKKTVRVQAKDRRESILSSLPTSVTPPGFPSLTTSRFPTITVSNNIEMEALVRWLQTTMEVLHSAAGSSDFFQKAARAVVDIVGLDTGRVLLLEKDQWKAVAVHAAAHIALDPAWLPSQNILTKVREEKRTFWQGPDQSDPELAESLLGVEVVVAAPILNREGEVIGAIYGDCRYDGVIHTKPQLSKLEAMLIELLASGVATGLARLEQEKAVVEADVRFGQFFTPELSRQLALQPDLLKGRDSEVTLLFCDIRAFSRISERLGPAGTVEWISDVMGGLSDCVLAHRGVLVDYIGDELLAMWGAPEEQEDHPQLACRAALDMLATLARLNERWQGVLNEPMALGIGINTGTARVGNTGSRHKFKYGPLGHTVNLASRVQGATKYLRSRLLITESTRQRLGAEFSTRRLCQVHVVNIARPVDLYELVPPGLPGWLEVKEQYEEALAEFERGRFRDAARILGNLLSEHADDGPTMVLLSRAITAVVEDRADFNPVWDLPGK
jgi:adenylate cyclase